jgi:hypothetical protein
MLVDPDGMDVEDPDPIKCTKFGMKLFERIGNAFRNLLWYDTKTTTTYKNPKTEELTATRKDKALNVRRNIKTESELSFESYTIEDQLIVKNKKGKEIFNSGSVGTDGNPITLKLKKGTYNIQVNPNTNNEQQDQSTVYNVTITSQRYTVKQRTTHRLWGFIPIGSRSHPSERNPERFPMPADLRPAPSFSDKKYFFK